MGKERRVRFLLEPAAAAAQDADADAEPGLPEGPVWLCSNGRPPATNPTAASRAAELEELKQHIEDIRERLRQALIRRGELRVQLGDGARHRPLRLLQGGAAAGEVP